MILKNDRYRKSRGGYSRLLELSCVTCGNKLFNYQKDGPGIIKRLYFDRIFDSKYTENKELICSKCQKHLGTAVIYEKENRPAYRLFQGTVSKKIVKVKNGG